MAKPHAIARLPVAQDSRLPGWTTAAVRGSAGRRGVANLDAEPEPEGRRIDLTRDCGCVGRSRAFTFWSRFEVGRQAQLAGGSFGAQTVRQGQLLAGATGERERSQSFSRGEV